MSTPKQIAANRNNAQKSTGPQTPAGKKRSSRNAIKHGVFSRGVVSAWEDDKDFRHLLHQLIDDFQPTDTFEMLQVEQMAVSAWKQARLTCIETAALDERLGRLIKTLAEQNVPKEEIFQNALGQTIHMKMDTVMRQMTFLNKQYYRAYQGLLHYRSLKGSAIEGEATQVSGAQEKIGREGSLHADEHH